MGLNVVVLANLKTNAPSYPGMPADAWAELDSETTVFAICDALAAAGHRATFLEGDLSLIEKLPALKPDICFNICEGHWGDSRESHVPAILEMLRIPYTGAGVLGLGLTLDKPLTKQVLAYHGLATPPYQVFQEVGEPLSRELAFPLFVKPSREGSSLGVTASSVVHTGSELRCQLAAQLERFRQPILVERFIQGRELTVGVIGNHAPATSPAHDPRGNGVPAARGLRVLPPLLVELEKYPSSENGVYTSRIKSAPGSEYFYVCPAPITPAATEDLQSLAAAAFRVTACLDIARVDFRLDADDHDRPYVLEVNALPGLCPGYSDLVLAAEASGIGYGALINGIFDAACARYGLGEPASR